MHGRHGVVGLSTALSCAATATARQPSTPAFDDFLRSRQDTDSTAVTAPTGPPTNVRGEYADFVYEHWRAAFEWQLTSAKIMFWCVMTIVAAGVLLTVMRIVYAMWAETKGIRKAQEGETNLEVSLSKVAVRSSTQGLIILTLSLVFLYLYLAFAFEIDVVSAGPPPSG